MESLQALLGTQGLPAWLARTRVLAALIGPDGNLLECNPAFKKFGKARGSADLLETRLAPGSRGPGNRLRALALETAQPTYGTLELMSSDAEPVEYECSFVPVADRRVIFLGEPVAAPEAGLAEMCRELSLELAQLKLDNSSLKRKLADKQIELEAVVMQAHEVSHTDDLTFLFNRRQIIGDLQREVMHAQRYRTPLSISMLDIDHFKLVNDTYGHTMGDLVLRTVARFLRDNIREPDFVGRYGGEEFLVLLPNSPLQAAKEQAARLCSRLRITPVQVEDKELRVTISIGVAEFRIGQEDWQKFLSRADAALYQAKAEGRDRWCAAP